MDIHIANVFSFSFSILLFVFHICTVSFCEICYLNILFSRTEHRYSLDDQQVRYHNLYYINYVLMHNYTPIQNLIELVSIIISIICAIILPNSNPSIHSLLVFIVFLAQFSFTPPPQWLSSHISNQSNITFSQFTVHEP